MSIKTVRITCKLPDVLFEVLAKQARKEHRPIEQVVIEWLSKHPHESPPPRARRKHKLERVIGSYRGNDPHAADNERIDADLAKEYARG